jgi:nucleoside-diphosphate-sugar epimerase
MRILVTGSTGNLGIVLVKELLNNGYEVIELTRNFEKSLKIFSKRTKKIVISDNHNSLINDIVETNPEICIHLASYLTSKDDYESILKINEINLLLMRVLDAIKLLPNFKLFINTGSFSQFSKNNNELDSAYLYSVGKNIDLEFLKYYSKTYNIKYLSIILFTVYGSLDSKKKIIDLILDSLKSKTPIKLTNGKQILDFTYIDDIVKFYIEVIENYTKFNNSSIIKFGTGTGTSITQLAAFIENITFKKTNISWGAINYRENDIMKATCPKSVFNKKFKFTDLREGLKNYISLLNNNSSI